MDKKIKALHERAIEVSVQYRKCEDELIDLIQELDRVRGYHIACDDQALS